MQWQITNKEVRKNTKLKKCKFTKCNFDKMEWPFWATVLTELNLD